jgi:alpha-D-xyloside xylohydrolase
MGPWDYGQEALDIYRKYAVLYMSMFPYRYAAAQESAANGLPMMRALALMHQDDSIGRRMDDEYEFGPEFLVAPILSAGTQRSVYLPEGNWLDYWSGKSMEGKQTVVADAPLDRIPLYVRSGAVIAKIPDDIMTLVPEAESHNSSLHALDDRRIYDIYPGSSRSIVDFEGRTVQCRQEGSGGSFDLSGKPAKVTLRWKFSSPQSITLGGKPLKLEKDANGAYVSFDHTDKSEVTWK